MSVTIKSSFLLLVLGAILPPPTAAQEHLDFDRLTIKDGLSQSYVMSIIQDQQGFLWFGTEDGLNRYDGYSFEIFKYNPRDAHSISNSIIYTLYEDSRGTIWIGTISGGLNKYEPGRKGFKAFKHDPEDDTSLSDNTVLSILEDRRGRLWIGTNNGLNKYHPETETFERISLTGSDGNSLSHDHIYDILEDSQGRFWIGTQFSGLILLDRETATVKAFSHNPNDPTSIGDSFVHVIYEDGRGRLWIGTQAAGLQLFDPDDGSFTRFAHDPMNPESISDNTVQAIHEDGNGILWVGTSRGGLNMLDTARGAFKRLRHSIDDPNSLSHDYVTCIFEDRSNILWFGTLSGISKYNKRRQMFNHQHHVPGDADSLSADNVFALFEDSKGDLWIGTDSGGLNLLPRGSNRYLSFLYDPNDPGSIGRGFVRSILEDRKGNLWIGTSSGGLNKYDPVTGDFVHYQADERPGGLRNNYIRVICQDAEGGLWLGTNGGLVSFDPVSETFVHFSSSADNPSAISSGIVYCLLEDGKGVFWVGTRYGLNIFHPDTRTCTRYFHDPEDDSTISENEILDIFECSDGTLWVGTNNGLNKYDRERDKFSHYTEEDGLCNNTVYSIEEDEFGNLWLGTNNGLSKFDSVEESFTNYFEHDGLQSNEFNLGASFKNGAGELFFGGVSGFNRFRPSRIMPNPHVPPVVITALRIFGAKVASPSEAWAMDKFELFYFENFFTLEFSALEFSAPDNNMFMYMLEGVDQGWIITSRPSADYTNIHPGEYIFRLKGSNNDGVWNQAGTWVRILVHPPFWDAWWFRGLAALSLILVVIAFLSHRRSRHERQKETLRKEVETRTIALQTAVQELEDFAHTVSHDLRAPIRHIKDYVGILLTDPQSIGNESGKQILQRVNRAAGRMDQLISDLLWLSRASRQELQYAEVNLSTIAKEIVKTLRINDPARNIEVSIADDLVAVGDERLLRIALENLLGNAWKFTSKRGSARIEFGSLQSDSRTVYFVRDNGVGFRPEEVHELFQPFKRLHVEVEFEGTGVGLATVGRIVGRHNGRIWAEAEVGQGATFFYTLNE